MHSPPVNGRGALQLVKGIPIPATRRRELECIRCRHVWVVDLNDLSKATRTIFKGDPNANSETFHVVCPNCSTPNIIEEPRDSNG